MVAAAVALSLGALQLDKAMSPENEITALGWWTFTRGPEGSRVLLSTVAGSMMTIVSVTFSITIVALQLASSQFGPRLLRNFMADRGNQMAMGVFIATFTYCLLILRSVNGTESERFVPHISVSVALLLTLLSLGVLIYFIHHAAESIQAENVIAAVSLDLHHQIERLYPNRIGHEPPEAAARGNDSPIVPTRLEKDGRSIASKRSDYVQAIDIDRILQLAAKRDLVVSVRLRPGKFSIEGGELARAWPAERVDNESAETIRTAFYFGTRRSLPQDVEFAIDQLVEVAVRALSPGINDPFTAITCIDRLGAALCELANRSIPSPCRYDEESKLRVITDVSTISGIVDASFHQIRQAARGTTSVTLRLLETMTAVAAHTSDPEFLAALRRHAEAVHRGSEGGLLDELDRAAADRRYRAALQALERSPEPLGGREGHFNDDGGSEALDSQRSR